MQFPISEADRQAAVDCVMSIIRDESAKNCERINAVARLVQMVSLGDGDGDDDGDDDDESILEVLRRQNGVN